MLEIFYLVFTAVFTSVPTAFSAAIAVIFSSFDMMRIKLTRKIKTKCCPHVEHLFTSRAE